LPQFKTILANLEEGNIPLTSITVSGETADDVLYLPAIKQAKASLAQTGLLWVADSKLGSLKNRSFIEKEEDYYLCPLSKVQLPTEKLLSKYLQKVLDEEIELEEIIYKDKVVAQGYVTSEEKQYDGDKWIERQFVVKSEQYAKSQERGLNSRLKKAIEEIEKLNRKASGKRVYKTTEELDDAIRKIINNRKVKNLLKIEQKISYEEKEIRAYKGRSARIEKKMSYSVEVKIDTVALEERVNILGWRVYVSNQGEDLMDIQRAVGLYREEYKIERRIRNLKEEVTKLLPIFLKKDNRIRGLINLLMLALKIISGIEYKVPKNLAKNEEELGGIYAGNPKITTATPTINKMMEAFKYYAIVFMFNDNEITQTICPELNPTQSKIIKLMEINKTVFELKNSD
jgi:transposase